MLDKQTNQVRWLRMICSWMAVLLCSQMLSIAAFAKPKGKETVSIEFSCREYITFSSYIDDVKVELAAPATLSDLMEYCKKSGYVTDYRFERKVLTHVTFANGIAFSAGDYGKDSGFFISGQNAQYVAVSDFNLKDNSSYTLNYMLHFGDNNIQIYPEEETNIQWEWESSSKAILDAACSWLYHNRTRGNKNAVTALGISKHPANPTDVVLLTQMADCDLDNLNSLVQTLYALSYCGYTYPKANGKNLMVELSEFSDPEYCTTDQLCSILQLYDAFHYDVSIEAHLSRNAIVQTLLSRQCEDGGFSLQSSDESNIRITAKTISVLEKYRDLKAVNHAVQNGISYLISPVVRNRMFLQSSSVDCETVAQMVIAVCSCNLPLKDIYFTKNGKTYADLLRQYLCVSGGFSMYLGEAENESATIIAILALYALECQSNPYVTDIQLVQFDDVVNQEKAPETQMPAANKREDSSRLKQGFWLIFFCVLVLFLVEGFYYFLHRKQTDPKDRK